MYELRIFPSEYARRSDERIFPPLVYVPAYWVVCGDTDWSTMGEIDLQALVHWPPRVLWGRQVELVVVHLHSPVRTQVYLDPTHIVRWNIIFSRLRVVMIFPP